MTTVPLLDELALVAGLGVAVTLVLSRLKLPTVAGLLASGAIAGPFGLGLVTSVHSIEMLAEVGVVMLLFTIGLEFSLSRLKNIFQQVALGGVLQVGLTLAVTIGIARAYGFPMRTAIFFGFVFALSSTAIALRALTERRETDAPHGKFIVGTLIFQDLCVVPMVLIVPLLATSAGAVSAATEIGVALGKAAALVTGVVVVARFVVPRALGWVDASRSREVFLLAILAICIGTAWLTSLAGLSLALGAFLGGIVVADTDYGHRAMSDMLPLRDAFVSVFFVSLGMLFDIRVVIAAPLVVIGLLAGFLIVKGLLATLAAMVMKFPSRAAWLAGVGLAQFGEFGFVLAKLGEQHEIVDRATMQPVLAAGIASMFLTPLLVRMAPHITAGERLLAPLEKLIGVRGIDQVEPETKLSQHVVIIGYGLAGRLLSRALSAIDVSYVVLELNAETVRRERKLGVPIYYGDATSEEALEHAHLSEARTMVVLMNDPQAAERVIATAKRVAPSVPVVVRTRYFLERQALVTLGASDVVAEEVEGSVEIISRLLRALEVPRNVIDEQVGAARAQTMQSSRTPTVPRQRLAELQGLSDLKIESVVVRTGSVVENKSPMGLRFRSNTGALVVGVRRDDQLLEHPDPTLPFQVGDVVYIVGTGDAVKKALPLFEAAPTI